MSRKSEVLAYHMKCISNLVIDPGNSLVTWEPDDSYASVEQTFQASTLERAVINGGYTSYLVVYTLNNLLVSILPS